MIYYIIKMIKDIYKEKLLKTFKVEESNNI